jgi:hypothetical protein
MQGSITFSNLISVLNEIGLKSTSQRFFYVDEIPPIVYEDLDNFLFGKTIGVKNDRKIIYYSDINDWLRKVWEKGLSQ